MNKSTANHRRVRIPTWINLINIVVIAILVFQFISAFINPSWAYGAFENKGANQQALFTLAGRNFVLIAVTVLALKSQNVHFLKLVFLINFLREFYDMLLVGYLNQFSIKGIGMMATFLIFLLPYLFALKTLRQLTTKEVC